MAARRKDENVGPTTPPDYQEQAALDRAAQAVERFPGANSARAIAGVAISEWIIARTSMAASVRLNADLLFDLGDARLRGFVEAALPHIAMALTAQGFDFNMPFGALEKSQVVDFITAGIVGAQEAAVAANESLGFPFDDEIPFPKEAA